MGDLPDGLTRCTAPSVVRVMVMIAAALAAAVLLGVGSYLFRKRDA